MGIGPDVGVLLADVEMVPSKLVHGPICLFAVSPS